MGEQRPVTLPVGVATGIGSLPHFDPGEAVEFVLRHSPRLPFAPSLPARSRREGMIPQAASGIAGVDVQPDGSLVIDDRSLDPEAPIDPETFAGDAYTGLRAFLTVVADREGPIKVSMTGPVTLGIALHAAGISAPLAFRVAAEASASRARAMLDLVRRRVPSREVVMFVDEPSLACVGDDSFPVTPTDAIDLVSGTLAAIEPRAVTGLHCCGSADWRNALQAGPQLLSLPVDAGVEGAAGPLADFVERGGWLAWGAVPTDRPIGSTIDRSWRRLSVLWCDLVGAGCDPVRLRTQAMITPACGLARHGVTQAEQVMGFTTRLAERLHDQAIGVRLSVGA
jgi:hypothetical protein